MEREQIIKALEHCTRGRKQDDIPCFDCSYNECNVVGGTSERQITGTCQGWLMKDALALINSQEQMLKELTEENESLKQAMEHEHASFMETFGEYGEKCERLTEENERLSTALANYDRQTELRIAEEYYTAEAYEELCEENERLRAEVSVKKKLLDKCVDIEDKVRSDTVQEYREGLHKEFASLGAKDKFNKEFFLTKADQIAKEMSEGK